MSIFSFPGYTTHEASLLRDKMENPNVDVGEKLRDLFAIDRASRVDETGSATVQVEHKIVDDYKLSEETRRTMEFIHGNNNPLEAMMEIASRREIEARKELLASGISSDHERELEAAVRLPFRPTTPTNDFLDLLKVSLEKQHY